jgi:FtsZ-binding cell division protein ZapB
MADTGACMTPDQCFDEMAVALGVAEPKDTGYTELLDLVKKLKKETEELKHKEYCLRQDAKGYSPSEVQEYREETEELKEENKKLKEENKVLKADDKYQQRIISKYSEENDMWHRVNDELTEENEKLKQQNEDLTTERDHLITKINKRNRSKSKIANRDQGCRPDR